MSEHDDASEVLLRIAANGLVDAPAVGGPAGRLTHAASVFARGKPE